MLQYAFAVEVESRTHRRDLMRRLQERKRRDELWVDGEPVRPYQKTEGKGPGLKGRMLFAIGDLLVSSGLSLKARYQPDSPAPSLS